MGRKYICRVQGWQSSSGSKQVPAVAGKRRKGENLMWEKFKKSAFAEKCRAFSKNRSAVILTVCLLLATAVIVSATVATNRAKKRYPTDEDNTNQSQNQGQDQGQSTEAPTSGSQGTISTPDYDSPSGSNGSDGSDGSEVNGSGEEFTVSLPVDGVLTKGHNSSIQVWSDTMGSYEVHLGLDIAAKENAPVCAVADGKITRIWDDAMMGRCVFIEHDGGICTVYKNLSETMASGIQAGATVKKGQQIGCVGTTAISERADDPHVHLEMTVGGLAVNPLDYMTDESKATLKVDQYNESLE